MEDSPALIKAAQSLVAEGVAARHRHLFVLSGERAWGASGALQIVQALPGEWCWIGDGSGPVTPQLEVEKAHTLLGVEWGGLVYDAWAGFDADAFGAVAGTIRSGGLLLLLTPPLDEWPDFADPQRHRLAVYPYLEAQVGRRFLGRLAGIFRASADCYLAEQGKALPPIPAGVPPPVLPEERQDDGCASTEQRAAVEALCRVAQGHRRRPLVLVSDRGRGKTTALGLAASSLLQQGIKRIVVTAPRLAAVEQLFSHAAGRLGIVESAQGVLQLPDGGELLFVSPDRVVSESIECDLLLVDEAAAIPVPLLQVMLSRHARIAFATTVHGYEGTGRGFDLRFRRILERETPSWRRLRLEQPIRWAAEDPLERLVFQALLLDAEPAAEEAVTRILPQQCRIVRVQRDALLDNEELLIQLFGLLVLAHYRTSPSDLQNLLDGPNLEIFLLQHGETLLGCALIAREGGLDEVLAEKVYGGERRLRGNLLPQSLATHAGLRQAARMQTARVMRIAIHPACQRRGLGRQLIEGVTEVVREEGIDYLGASFGADLPLLDFWKACGCRIVHMGLRRETSSGAHAALVLRPISTNGATLYQLARQRFAQQLPALLTEPLADLEPELVAALFEELPIDRPGEMAWEDTRSFAYTHRDYGNCLDGLSRCLAFTLADRQWLPSRAEYLLAIAKVLQRQSWQRIARQTALTGRKEVMEKLRALFRTIVAHYTSTK